MTVGRGNKAALVPGPRDLTSTVAPGVPETGRCQCCEQVVSKAAKMVETWLREQKVYAAHRHALVNRIHGLLPDSNRTDEPKK